MRRDTRRWVPLLIAVALALFAGTAPHLPAPPRAAERVAHVCVHAAAVPVHFLGTVTDATPSGSAALPMLLLALLMAMTLSVALWSRRTTLVPARAPPTDEAPTGS